MSKVNLSIRVPGLRWVLLYTVAYFVLKVTHVIDWSWLFVWLPLAVWVGLSIFFIIVLFISAMAITFTKE